MVWHHDILVQDGRVGAPLARTACHVMRDEPFSFSLAGGDEVETGA